MPKLSVEEIIRRAIQEGKFDDLPGKGKPLALDENPLEDPEWRAAYHILKSGGFTLPWIETLRQIESDLEVARDSLSHAWAWQCESRVKESKVQRLESDWEHAVQAFQEQIAVINDQIRAYNLEVPNDQFQLHLINVDKEIERIKNSLD